MSPRHVPAKSLTIVELLAANRTGVLILKFLLKLCGPFILLPLSWLHALDLLDLDDGIIGRLLGVLLDVPSSKILLRLVFRLRLLVLLLFACPALLLDRGDLLLLQGLLHQSAEETRAGIV